MSENEIDFFKKEIYILKRTLFEQKNDSIWIKIEIHFTKDSKIIVYGHDSGKIVQKLKSSYDYEYYVTVESEEVNQLYSKVIEEDKFKSELLLDWFQKIFNTSKAYSQIREKLTELDIKFQTSVW